MREPVILVESLSKQYRIGGSQGKYSYGSLRDSLANTARNSLRILSRRSGDSSRSKNEYIWALKDVSFEVQRGETLGIIGRNGAGKSTLLKILSRITKPTEGRAIIRGRVGSLLEVGTGFHPELTGRENIYLNGSILGMQRKEIDLKFDEIVSFSEIEKFLDTPVKFYSSGMYVRLAFAVAAHLEPEILLVDEVLAVGDTAFQKKCLGKMENVAKRGRTVLFVSHNMAAVENLCQRGIVLNQGYNVFMGSSDQAITFYLSQLTQETITLLERTDRVGSGDLKVTNIDLCDINGNKLEMFSSGQDVEIHLHYQSSPGFRSQHVITSLMFKTHLDIPVFLQHNRLTKNEFGELPITGKFICQLRELPLPASTYRISYSIMQNNEYLDSIDDALEVTVAEGDFFNSGEIPPISHGVCLVKGEWRVED